jgi:hypothetical protein
MIIAIVVSSLQGEGETLNKADKQTLFHFFHVVNGFNEIIRIEQKTSCD